MALIMFFCALAAAAFEAGEGPHRVHQHLTARQPYAVCDCDGTELCTHLPLVVINTNGQEIPGEVTENYDKYGETIYLTADDGRSVIDVDISIIDNQSRNNHPSDEPEVETISELRLRGHSSRTFDKQSYLLNFVDEEGNGRDLPVMGMSAHSDWVLYGPSLDKTLVRNYMWYNIAGEVMEWAPNVRYCEVILNGEYQGLYLMVETITNGDDCRLDLTDVAYGTAVTGYLLREDRSVETDVDGIRDVYSYIERMLTIATDIEIRYPKKPNLSEELRKAIEQDFAAFEKTLYSYDYDTKDYGYWHYIDEQNFVDYYLINEFTLNIDAGSYSTYIYKDMSGKYKLAVWDFNNACGNYIEDETGILRYGNANPKAYNFDSLADFMFTDDGVEIRVPYELLNFLNPSEMMIHDDYYECYGIEGLHIDSMYVGFAYGEYGDERIDMTSFELEGWGKTVTYHERLKRSYYILRDYWAELDENSGKS